MSGRAFVDTNVFVYAFDDADPAKRDRARTVLSSPERPLVISTQVVGEFYVVATRRLANPLAADAAGAAVDQMLRLPVVSIDPPLVRDAVNSSQRHGLSYWDALIVQAAVAGKCDVLLTEDLADGATIGPVKIKNPFAGTRRR